MQKTDFFPFFRMCVKYMKVMIFKKRLCLTRLKNKKFKVRDELIEKYENMNQDFEQDCY